MIQFRTELLCQTCIPGSVGSRLDMLVGGPVRAVGHFDLRLCSGCLCLLVGGYFKPVPGRQDSWLLGRWTHDQKIESLDPGKSFGMIFFCRVNFVWWLYLFTPVLLQWHVKDPPHSAKSAGGRLHHTGIHPWPNEVGVGFLFCCPGIAHMRPQSSQRAEPLWTDSGLKSRISECELISKCMQGRNGQTSPKKPPFQTSILPEGGHSKTVFC